MISELKTFYRIYADTRNENTGKIVAKQNDTKTRYLDITVTDNGVPVDLTGCEVRIYGRKKDGTEFYNDGTLQDAENGRCLFEATTQMLAYAGQNVNCEIVVFKDNEQILSTMPFDIFVVESLMGESAIESSNEYGALVILYQNLYEAIDLMTTMVQNIGSPSTVAEQYNLETMWQAWEFLVAYMKGDLTTMISNALANSSVQGVLDKIGNTNDTGGSETEGTLMAKGNAVLKASTEIKDIIQKVAGIGDYLFIKTEVSEDNSKDWVDKEVLRIEGSGKLFWAEFKNSMRYEATRFSANDYSAIKLIVDGETHTNFKYAINALSYGIYASILVGDEKYIKHDGNSYVVPSRLIGETYIAAEIYNNDETVYTHAGGSNYSGIRHLMGYLPFKESVTVVVSSVGTPTDNWTKTFLGGIAYTLDEE